VETLGDHSASATLLDMAKRKKNAAAVSLGKKRWKGLTPEQRSTIAREAVEKRWAAVRAKRAKKAP
jgi:hypothetical protein